MAFGEKSLGEQRGRFGFGERGRRFCDQDGELGKAALGRERGIIQDSSEGVGECGEVGQAPELEGGDDVLDDRRCLATLSENDLCGGGLLQQTMQLSQFGVGGDEFLPDGAEVGRVCGPAFHQAREEGAGERQAVDPAGRKPIQGCGDGGQRLAIAEAGDREGEFGDGGGGLCHVAGGEVVDDADEDFGQARAGGTADRAGGPDIASGAGDGLRPGGERLGGGVGGQREGDLEQLPAGCSDSVFAESGCDDGGDELAAIGEIGGDCADLGRGIGEGREEVGLGQLVATEESTQCS